MHSGDFIWLDWWQSDVQIGDQRKPTTIDVKENEVIEWPLCIVGFASIQDSQRRCISISLHSKKVLSAPVKPWGSWTFFWASFLTVRRRWKRVKQEVLFQLEMSQNDSPISIRAQLSQSVQGDMCHLHSSEFSSVLLIFFFCCHQETSLLLTVEITFLHSWNRYKRNLTRWIQDETVNGADIGLDKMKKQSWELKFYFILFYFSHISVYGSLVPL